ncbi:MAG: 8-oxo-dGTP diphosphatase [Oscillospiraceae bacterium]|nr:8-oxo-dGTP diphosphatase [Oscillospiraceae bacterium]
MDRSEKVIITNICMIYNGGRVLVENRTNPDWPGITFPGGHVEKGESFTDAVIREVYEETGLKISFPRLCGIKDWTEDDGSRYMVLFYKTDKFSGELASSDEGEVFWTKLSELKSLDLAEGMDKQLEVFLNDDLSEDFFYKENGSWIEVIK